MFKNYNKNLFLHSYFPFHVSNLSKNVSKFLKLYFVFQTYASYTHGCENMCTFY